VLTEWDEEFAMIGRKYTIRCKTSFYFDGRNLLNGTLQAMVLFIKQLVHKSSYENIP
jgi:hypothetical protein